MRIALFWKYLSLSLALAAMVAASGCSNCGTSACAPAPQKCGVVATCADNVSYRPDLYAAVSCQNPVASQKTSKALTKALSDAPAAKAVEKPAAKPAAPAPAPAPAPVKVLPPVMPEAKPAPQPAAAGCLVPADTPLAPADVASYVTSEHYDIVEPEIVGEPLPPMPTFKGQWPVEPPMDPAP